MRAWRDGVLVNVFNPKTIVFMFAFLPPFVRPENGAPLLQLFILGMIFNIGGTLVNCGVAIFAGSIGEKLATNARARPRLRDRVGRAVPGACGKDGFRAALKAFSDAARTLT